MIRPAGPCHIPNRATTANPSMVNSLNPLSITIFVVGDWKPSATKFASKCTAIGSGTEPASRTAHTVDINTIASIGTNDGSKYHVDVSNNVVSDKITYGGR